MTPKEKAKELFDKYFEFVEALSAQNQIENAKQCALITVDEIIKSEPRYPSDVDWDDVGGTHQYYYEAQHEEALNYWQEVKLKLKEI